jgi:hypothetical protein
MLLHGCDRCTYLNFTHRIMTSKSFHSCDGRALSREYWHQAAVHCLMSVPSRNINHHATSGLARCCTYTICFNVLSHRETMTVHAPQPPSPHPSLVPVSEVDRRYCNIVVSGSTSRRVTFLPLTKNTGCACQVVVLRAEVSSFIVLVARTDGATKR